MEDKRKHFSQMQPDEISLLINAVRSRLNGHLNFSSHALLRMKSKRVSIPQILASLSYGKPIEIHNNVASEIRVLMRGKVAGKYVCSVVSLTTNEVVTVYWNDGLDHHATLDKSAYTWSINVKELSL
jgi:hypothetical protein